MHRMGGFLAVDRRLGVDGQKAMSIQINKVVPNRGDLGTDRAVAPREILDFSEDVICKEIMYICNRSGKSPPFSSLVGGAFEPNTVQVEFPVRRRPCVSPSAVGEFVPLLSPCDVALVAILPKYWTNILLLPSICETLRSI